MSTKAPTLTEEQFATLIRAIPQGRHKVRNTLILYLTHKAGMRVGEISTARVADICGDKIRGRMVKGSRRWVYLDAKLVDMLSIYTRFKKGEDYLFTTKNGIPFSSTTLQQTIKSLYRKAGLGECSSHSGRRSFITNLSRKGCNVRVIQELVGHRYLNTTMSYIDVTEEDCRIALSRVL